MSKKRKELSHEEIWDDSELVDSWNEALAEYKHYHSLQARGEKIEDVIRDAEAAEADQVMNEDDPEDVGDYTFADDGEDEGLEDGELDDDDDNNAEAGRFEASMDRSKYAGQTASTQAVQGGPSFAGIPQALNTGGADEGLKNLMMAWYYAGYYTGLYEGQQQASTAGQTKQAEKQSTDDAAPENE